MANPDRVLVAMSGGVDSSVAAARLVDAGYDVIGVTLHLWDYPEDGGEHGRCCAPEDQHDARRCADFLGIPHYTFDRRELFRMSVVEPFVEAYLAGLTPSPCVECNRSVKMRELFQIADRLDAGLVATGHYARIVETGDRTELHRGRDHTKDQAYFLHMLREDELARVLLPLGDSTKEDVRAEAERRRLPGAGKGESQEICFVPTGRYDAFVSDRAGASRVRPGPIVDRDGRAIGAHQGVHAFTIGQRKGLGVALGKPAFVVGLDAESATVRVGDEADLYTTAARIENASFRGDVVFPLEAQVRVRARHEGQRAIIDKRRDPGAGEGEYLVLFGEPVRAVSPGQVAVAYLSDRVVGGGTITAALSPRRDQEAPR